MRSRVALASFLTVLMWCSALSAQTIDGCPVFPADNPWNEDISQLPVHPLSDMYIAAINKTRQVVHPDFGSNPAYGIPYIVVPGTEPFVPITYTAYGDESDPGPMPIPQDAPIEGGSSSTGDRHVLVIDYGNCMLYELFGASPNGTGWDAASGAIFDLSHDKYRPDGWTSADAAGLPIFPGLARLDECKAGEIKHALRFTTPTTQKGWIFPARHMAGLGDTTYPPMGLRLRLKANYDISSDTGYAKVILTALKKYGMILADNGSAWFISGETNTNWSDDDLSQLKKIPGSAFEAVYTGEIRHTPESSVADHTIEFKLYPVSPNPVSGVMHVHLDLPSAGAVSLKLYDALGRAVVTRAAEYRAEGDNEIDVPVTSVSAGAYLLQVGVGEKVVGEMVEVMR